MIDAGSLANAVLRCELGAVARAITLVEDCAAEAGSLLKSLHAHTGRSFVMGVTGPPGAGKSTLVDCLAKRIRASGERVGIIAVDPTSAFSGGALLGDRIRMQSAAADEGIFIRSMATRGSLGGLSRKVPEAVQVLDAAGFGTIVIETVGVGQAEIDVTRAADISILVLVPGLGDDVQALKAGIMEIGDVFALNKSDRHGAEDLKRQVQFFLSLSDRRDGWVPPIVETIATQGHGIEELWQSILNFRKFYQDSDLRKLKRKEIVRHQLLELLRDGILSHLLDRDEGAARINDWVQRVAEREIDIHTAAEAILTRCRKKPDQ